MKEIAAAKDISDSTQIESILPCQYSLSIVDLNDVEAAFNGPFDRCNPSLLQIFNTVLCQCLGLW